MRERCAFWCNMARVFVIALWIHVGLLRASSADEVSDLRNQKKLTADAWWRDANVNLGGEFNYGNAFKASLALKDAELECAANNSARLRALQAHSDRMQGLFDEIKKLYVVGLAGGSSAEMFEVKYLLLQSKVWIKEEQMRGDNSKK